jgi:hypothetical protein
VTRDGLESRKNTGVAHGDGPEGKKNPGVLYGDGRYYRKDRTDKVSHIGNSKKCGKAADKPTHFVKQETERSATGKPNIDNTVLMTGTVSETDFPILDSVNPITFQQGQKKLAAQGGKEEMGRLALLEQQLKVEREKSERMEQHYAQERERLVKEHAREQQLVREEAAKMVEQRELEAGAGTVDKSDVYELDEDLIRAGPYYNVRAARARAMEDEVVLGDGRKEKRKEAAFNIKGEGRLSQVEWRHRLDVGQNITLSFNPANMRCNGCKARGQHSVIGSDDGKPVVLVACDQNFPPVLFSEDDGACIGILRMEYGSVKELGFAVGDMLHGVSLPQGSVILVGSTSDLAQQGIVGYTDELARTLRILKEKLGGRVEVVALPPVPLGGINSFSTLRGVVEVEHWAERLEGGAGVLLLKTRSAVVQLIAKHAKGVVTDPEEKVDTLLKKVGGYERVRVRSIIWHNMPERMKPLSQEGEKIIVDTLVEELRQNFGVRVSSRLILSREGGEGRPVTKYVVMGGSNADRVGDMLEERGKDVIKLTKGGWRPSKQGVQDMVEMMEKVDLEGRVAILYGMDNATFYAEDEDGDRALPKPDKDNKYHVVGKVEVATAKQARGLVHNCEPILVRLKGNKMVLVTPGVRFFREPCCVTVGHCTNLEDGGYRRGMLEDLARLKEAAEDVFREGGMRNYKVVSPVEMLGIRAAMDENELIQILGADPVHMAQKGYQLLSDGLVRMVETASTAFSGGKRGREEEEAEEGIGNYHRKRHEWLFNVVSGTGGWGQSQQAKAGSMDKGRGGGAFPFGKKTGNN